MTARSFGRKRVEAEAAPSRRAAFLAPVEPATIDEGALRRAAFVADERARAAPPAQAEIAMPPPPEPAPPTDRSLDKAYILWLCTGLAGGHRFYLRRPLTGALQAALFVGSWGAAVAEYYAAFGGLGLSALWMVVDGALIARLHRTAGAR